MCRAVQIGIRDTGLLWYERQAQLPRPACDSTSLFQAAFALFAGNRPRYAVQPVRARLGLSLADEAPQLSFLPEEARRLRRTDLEGGRGPHPRQIRLREPPPVHHAHRSGPGPGREGTNIVHPIGFLGTMAESARSH